MKWVVASLLLLGCGAAITVALYGSFYGLTMQSKLRTAEVPVASATAIEIRKMDMLEWPSGQPIDRSKEMSCSALFEEWNISHQMKKGDDVCMQAQANGLRCLNGSSSLKELSLLNRPAVLKLFNEKGQEFYVTLRRIEGQSAVLIVGEEKMSVDSKELEKRWSGDYLLFWKVPENYNGNIHPGDKGAQIGWLERYLSSVEGKRPQLKSPLTYDNDLVRRVKKFQRGEGLITDGIVGPQTIIHLVNKKGAGEPLLIADKEASR